jgi:MFS transporter, PPP family, 3-phenylpropionic acid transporter
VADGAALHLANEGGGNLGSFRALATLGYIVTLFAAGFIVMWLGPWTFIPLFIALSLLRGFTSLLLPRFKMQGFAPAPTTKHKFKDFFQAWLFLPLIGWSIVYATHLVLNGFQSLLWSEQGYSSGMISTLIGLGAASEAVAFFAYKRISHKINLRGMIALSGIVTVLRWWAMSYDPQLFWLVPLQLLHGLTFALGFLACVNYIGKSFDKTVAAEAQSFFTVLQLTCGIVVITVFSWVSNAQDGNPYFANSLMALVGFLVITSAYFFKQPAPIAPDQSAQHPSPT